MPRKKKYIEEEVIDKALTLFWQYGYEGTSARMLEKAMGINPYSIYASFGNKQGVYIESIKCYRRMLNAITDKLKSSANGKEGVKQYFYDSVAFMLETGPKNGCFAVNTINERGNGDPMIMSEALKCFYDIKALFVNNLKQDGQKDFQTIEKQADNLMMLLTGLLMASKIYSKEKLDHFIENTFENI